jgi:hypothetical protein
MTKFMISCFTALAEGAGKLMGQTMERETEM